MRTFRSVLAFVFGFVAAQSMAHEMWIEPLEYQVSPSGQLQAKIVNGEDFSGTSLPYLPNRFSHFIVYANGRSVQVAGRPGDVPALNMQSRDAGLHIVAYQSTVSTLTYQTWAKFQKFVDHKDFGDIRTQHDARGLPEEGFKEAYTRYSKSLIGVGPAAGADLRIGLETEIVALTNPYVDDLSNGMRVQVFYGQIPRANVQVEVFEKASPEAEARVFTLRTDADGIATIPVKPAMTYQLDSVVLREPSATLAAERSAAWETLWANLTFRTP